MLSFILQIETVDGELSIGSNVSSNCCEHPVRFRYCAGAGQWWVYKAIVMAFFAIDHLVLVRSSPLGLASDQYRLLAGMRVHM